MKILLITQEPPLLSEVVVSGNAVRTRQISRALASAGRALAESMDWKTIAEKYNSLYATLP